jgi:hypothetical protein
MAMRSNGGISNGVVHGMSSGLSPFNATFLAFSIFAAAVFRFLPTVCSLFFTIVDALAHAFMQEPLMGFVGGFVETLQVGRPMAAIERYPRPGR